MTADCAPTYRVVYLIEGGVVDQRGVVVGRGDAAQQAVEAALPDDAPAPDRPLQGVADLQRERRVCRPAVRLVVATHQLLDGLQRRAAPRRRRCCRARQLAQGAQHRRQDAGTPANAGRGGGGGAAPAAPQLRVAVRAHALVEDAQDGALAHGVVEVRRDRPIAHRVQLLHRVADPLDARTLLLTLDLVDRRQQPLGVWRPTATAAAATCWRLPTLLHHRLRHSLVDIASVNTTSSVCDTCEDVDVRRTVIGLLTLMWYTVHTSTDSRQSLMHIYRLRRRRFTFCESVLSPISDWNLVGGLLHTGTNRRVSSILGRLVGRCAASIKMWK